LKSFARLALLLSSFSAQPFCGHVELHLVAHAQFDDRVEDAITSSGNTGAGAAPWGPTLARRGAQRRRLRHRDLRRQWC
jgi:hypothetical protein